MAFTIKTGSRANLSTTLYTLALDEADTAVLNAARRIERDLAAEMERLRRAGVVHIAVQRHGEEAKLVCGTIADFDVLGGAVQR